MPARRRLGYGNLGSLNLRGEFGFDGRFLGRSQQPARLRLEFQSESRARGRRGGGAGHASGAHLPLRVPAGVSVCPGAVGSG